MLLDRERLLGGQPIAPAKPSGQLPGGLGFGLLTCLSFLIFQPRLCNEQLAIRQRSNDIRQVMMGFALKNIANGERGILWSRQSVGGCKVGIDVAASIPSHLGMVFQVHQEPFLQLATERLPDMMRVPRFEAGNPTGDGATSNLEQVNATHL